MFVKSADKETGTCVCMCVCVCVSHHRSAILAHPRIKLKEHHVRPVAEDKLLVYAPDESKQNLMFSLQKLLTILPQVSLVA